MLAWLSEVGMQAFWLDATIACHAGLWEVVQSSCFKPSESTMISSLCFRWRVALNQVEIPIDHLGEPYGYHCSLI